MVLRYEIHKVFYVSLVWRYIFDPNHVAYELEMLAKSERILKVDLQHSWLGHPWDFLLSGKTFMRMRHHGVRKRDKAIYPNFVIGDNDLIGEGRSVMDWLGYGILGWWILQGVWMKTSWQMRSEIHISYIEERGSYNEWSMNINKETQFIFSTTSYFYKYLFGTMNRWVQGLVGEHMYHVLCVSLGWEVSL